MIFFYLNDNIYFFTSISAKCKIVEGVGQKTMTFFFHLHYRQDVYTNNDDS